MVSPRLQLQNPLVNPEEEAFYTLRSPTLKEVLNQNFCFLGKFPFHNLACSYQKWCIKILCNTLIISLISIGDKSPIVNYISIKFVKTILISF